MQKKGMYSFLLTMKERNKQTKNIVHMIPNYVIFQLCNIRARVSIQNKRGTKDTKGTVKLINLKQTDNAKVKNERDKQTTAHMTQHRKPKNKQPEPHQKTRGDLRCSGRVSRSCSTRGTRRVAYVITNPVKSLIR